MQSFSVVLPCYNEEENIEQTIADVCNWMSSRGMTGEVVAVDDGSADNTAEVLEGLTQKYSTLKVVHHTVNQGYGDAIITGCDTATMNVIGFMDSDGQFHAEDFDKLLPYIEQYPIVVGRRSRRADPFPRLVNAFLYGRLVRLALGVRIRDINCGMKIFRRDAWPTIRPRIASGALFNAEVLLRAKGAGLRWKQTPVTHYPRTAGTPTGAKISVILKMFAELFTLKRAYVQEQRQGENQ